MPKIRRKSIENDFFLIFFYIQSKGAAQSSILMILRHPLSYLLITVFVNPGTIWAPFRLK